MMVTRLSDGQQLPMETENIGAAYSPEQYTSINRKYN